MAAHPWEPAALAAAEAVAGISPGDAAQSQHPQLHMDGSGPLPPPGFADAAAGLDSSLAADFSDAFDPASSTNPSTSVISTSTTTFADHLPGAAIASDAHVTSTSKKRPRASTSKGKGKQKDAGQDDHADKSTADDASVKKRRRVVVACDTCRRKKIRCQGLPNDNHTCDNCATYGYKCAFTFSAKGGENGDEAGGASSAAGKGRTRGRYEILEAKVDNLLSIVRTLDPDVAARWESGELGAGAGAISGVKKFAEAKTEPGNQAPVATSSSMMLPSAPDPFQSGDQDPNSSSNVNAQYSAYLHDNVFGPASTASDLWLDTALGQTRTGSNADQVEGASAPAPPPPNTRDRRKGKAGTGGDAHASAGLLLHLSQAAVHVQERDQRARDGPDGDDAASGGQMSRADSSVGRGPSHLLPDIEDGRPRFYGKSSTMHFFNTLDSRPSSPPAEVRSGKEKESDRKASVPLYPLNSKQWVRLLRKKNLVAVGRDDDLADPDWFNRYQLPEPQTVATLLSTYFTTFHPLMPIVHRLSLERDLAFGRAEHDTAFRGLVFTLLAIASRLGMSTSEKARLASLSEEERMKEVEALEIKSDYYAAGSRMYHQVYAASLINVQVLLLTATFMHGSIGAGTAWTVLGVGIRVLLDIGLHSERAYTGFSPFEQELRRRVFWGAYILDCIFAVNMGRPSALRLEECSVQLPVDVSEEGLLAAEGGGPIDTNYPKGDQGRKANIMSGFVHLAKLNVLVGDVVQTLYVSKTKLSYSNGHDRAASRPTQQQPAEKDMVRLLKALDQWVSEQPAHLKGPDVDPIFKLQSGIITCGTHDIRLYILKPFLQQPSLKAKLFPQCMEHARKLLDCVLKLFEDESLSGIIFIFQQAFWSAATFMITVWHHYKSSAALANDQRLIEGTLRILFSSDPQFFSSIMHRALRLLQRIAKRAMSEMEPARRERVSAYVEAEDLTGLTEIAPDLARPAYNIQPLPPQFGTGIAATQRGGTGTAGNSKDFQPWWHEAARSSRIPCGVVGPDGNTEQPSGMLYPYQTSSHDSELQANMSTPNLWLNSTGQNPNAGAAEALPSSSSWPGTASAIAGIGPPQGNHLQTSNGQQQSPHSGASSTDNVAYNAHPSLAYYNQTNNSGALPGSTASAHPVQQFQFAHQFGGQGMPQGHEQQQQQQQQQHQSSHMHPQAHPQQQQQHHNNMSMRQAAYQAAQTQIAFENSFGDAHGIAGVAGPNPTLDDLAWTDYFASFLASLSADNNANNAVHTGPTQTQ